MTDRIAVGDATQCSDDNAYNDFTTDTSSDAVKTHAQFLGRSACGSVFEITTDPRYLPGPGAAACDDFQVLRTHLQDAIPAT